MKAKKIFNRLAMAMLMPAMLLTTACSNDDDSVNNDNTAKKGYPLQVTINVTRQGDEGTTRATYNESTRKLEFSAGDQLFVNGSASTAGIFAGTLNYVSEGTFSGTIYTENKYSGTAKELIEASMCTAILLPAGYDSYNFLTVQNSGTYSAEAVPDHSGAFATSKATAVEQFSLEYAASEKSYSSEYGFALSPLNAILNFTITGLAASTSVDVALTYGGLPMISGKVTTDGAGNATFAMALQGGLDLSIFSLTVGGNAITLVSSSTPLTAGHIYNITRSAVTVPEGALSGKFTISHDNGMTTRQVRFSKGNLRANYNTSWSWSFFPNQWDYVGNASANINITGNGIVSTASDYLYVDLFGWVGASSNWTGVAQYGISNSTTTKSIDGYGNRSSENLKSDWGNVEGIGTGWFTLKSVEWSYLLSNRTTGGTVGSTSKARFAKATIRTDFKSVNGMILFPDGVNFAASEFTTLGTVNGGSEYGTKCTSAQWTALENKGCVFLPAAGRRNGTSVENTDSRGYYWSSSSDTSDQASGMYIGSSYPTPGPFTRSYGFSVRLVREAE